jgi:hypothetical protein
MGTYLEIARRLRSRGDEHVDMEQGPKRVQPLVEACAACGSAMGWRDAAGVVTCAGCLPEPTGGERVVLVNLSGRNEWRNYADERLGQQRQSLLGQPVDDLDRVNRQLDEAAADEMHEEPRERR